MSNPKKPETKKPATTDVSAEVENNTESNPKMTASQRLDALEQMVMGHNQQFQILAEEIDNSQELIRVLAKRVNAAIKAAEEGGLSNDSVNKIILDENVQDLKNKVAFLVQNKLLTQDQSKQIDKDTFVVGREVDGDGNVANPRLQFSVPTMNTEIQKLFMGKKVGDLILIQETDLYVEIVELYTINNQEVNQKFEEMEDGAKETKESPEEQDAE